MPHEIFISYSEEDKMTADAVCHALERQGIRCWIAPRDIKYGASWGAAIVEALDASKVMVLIFSSKANISPHVNREVQHAFDKGVTVIPFRVENVEPTKALEYYISAVHWLDAMTPPIEQHIEKLIETVRQIIPPREEATKAPGAAETLPPTPRTVPTQQPPYRPVQPPPQRPIQPPTQRPIQAFPQKTSPGAMTALILGIASIFCLGFVLGPIAIILGNKELKAIDAGQSSLAQRGYAKTGVILGWVGTILNTLAFVYLMGAMKGGY